jgi:hypothetical protein
MKPDDTIEISIAITRKALAEAFWDSTLYDGHVRLYWTSGSDSMDGLVHDGLLSCFRRGLVSW